MESKFHLLPKFLAEAYENNDVESVRILAEEYLNLAALNKKDWNYGNAIHQANIYLGLIAVENDEIEEAKNYLMLAGQTPGSPQLNSFGPNMLLAKKLLENGEVDIILEYIKMCKKFWRFIFNFIKIKKWNQKIKKGLIPDFKAHLIYHLYFSDPMKIIGINSN